MAELMDAIWAEARKLDEFDWESVSALGCSVSSAQKFLRHWMRDGRVRIARIGPHQKRYYARADKISAPASPPDEKPTPEGNMWRVMQHLRQFSPTDIAGAANSGGIEVTLDKARAYCRQLLGSGHLRVRMTAIPGRREAIYRLVEDTGPRAPRPVRRAGIEDPNTGAFVPAKGGAA